MKKLRKGLIVSVKAVNTLFPTTFLNSIINQTDTEIIGKVFRVLPSYVELILSHKDRNMTIYNSTKLKLFEARNKIFRIAVDEEKEYWRKNDKLYSFSVNINYKSEITVVYELIFMHVFAAYLKRLFTSISVSQCLTAEQRIAKQMEINAILSTSATIGGRILEMNKNPLNGIKTTFNRHAAIDLVPSELFRVFTLSTIINKDWDELWQLCLYHQRMWLYRSYASNLTLEI